MNYPLVSIITAAYNAESHIRECIESIRKQTYQNWEMIICDDCSTDDTVSIAQEYSIIDHRIRVIRNKSNIKAGAARNRCIKESRGDYILIQDADDISDGMRIEKLVSAIQINKVEFVSSGFYLFDDAGAYKTCHLKKEYPSKKDFLSGMPFCHAATLFCREALVSVSGYRISNETLRNEDYDLFMRLYANGLCGCNIEDVLYGYRVDEQTLKRRKWSYRISECKVRYKGYKELGIFFPFGCLYMFKPVLAYFVQAIRGTQKGDNFEIYLFRFCSRRK